MFSVGIAWEDLRPRGNKLLSTYVVNLVRSLYSATCFPLMASHSKEVKDPRQAQTVGC